jgi:malate dehydrogenase
VIAARKMSSAMSAAKAAGDHMRDIWMGTPGDSYVSMAVLSDGSYGIPQDVMFSFPVTIKNRKWTIVQGLPLDDFSKGKLDVTAKELLEERREALSLCQE